MNAVVEYIPSCAKTGRHPMEVIEDWDGSGREYSWQQCSECGHYREAIEDDSIPEEVTIKYVRKAGHFVAFEKGTFNGMKSVGFTPDQALERYLKSCRERAVIEPEERT